MRSTITAGKLVLAATVTLCAQNALAFREYVIGPKIMRGFAVEAPLPTYPIAVARLGKEGTVVVEVAITAEGGGLGVIKSSTILESTDPEMAKSVVETLKSWRFKRFREMGVSDYNVKTRIVFYFRIVQGKSTVIDPADDENQLTIKSRKSKEN